MNGRTFQSGHYALGIEPSTHHVLGEPFARERNEMIWLEHDEERRYDVAFRVLDGAGAIAAAEARIAAVAKQPQEDYPEPSQRSNRLPGADAERGTNMAYVADSGRDYSLTGAGSRRAIETGLASAEWYHSDVPRRTMKELMQRNDAPAIRDTIIWSALHLISAAGGIYFWGTWWASRSSSSTACFMAPPAIRAGMKAATARRSRRPG